MEKDLQKFKDFITENGYVLTPITGINCKYKWQGKFIVRLAKLLGVTFKADVKFSVAPKANVPMPQGAPKKSKK